MEELVWALEFPYIAIEDLCSGSSLNNNVSLAFYLASHGFTPLPKPLREEGYIY
jgi:hypothetical protein